MSGKDSPNVRVLFAAFRYDYAEKYRGSSFEYENFFETMRKMNDVECDFFDIGSLGGNPDRRQDVFLRRVERCSPDILFVFPMREEIAPGTVRSVAEKGSCTTLCWFSDDHWRFDDFSSRYCLPFDYSVTTDSSAVEKYHRIGYTNVILSQWGCNHFSYRRIPLEKTYPVSFVGMAHGNRREIVERLQTRGITVQCFGYGWKRRLRKAHRAWNRLAAGMGLASLCVDSGRVGQEGLIRIFNQSKINLNLSNASVGGRSQIKGRNFEVPGCGGFLLTEEVDGLDRYFEPGREMVTYRNLDDLAEKILYYLDHEAEREEIAERAYRRVLRDHTYEKRLREIFHIVPGGER